MHKVAIDGQEWLISVIHLHPANVHGLGKKFLQQRIYRLKNKNQSLSVENVFDRVKKSSVLMDGVEYQLSELARHPANVHKVNYKALNMRIYHMRRRGQAVTADLLFIPLWKRGPNGGGRKKDMQPAKPKAFVPKVHKPGTWAGMAAILESGQ